MQSILLFKILINSPFENFPGYATKSIFQISPKNMIPIFFSCSGVCLKLFFRLMPETEYLALLSVRFHFFLKLTFVCYILVLRCEQNTLAFNPNICHLFSNIFPFHPFIYKLHHFQQGKHHSQTYFS